MPEDFPPGYIRAIDTIAGMARAFRIANPDASLDFVLGPSGVWIAAPLSVLRRQIARNPAARHLVDFVLASVPDATVMMFAVALEHAGIPFRRVSLGELGIGPAGKPS